MFLQALVNKSVNMAKQLYFSEIHLKIIKIYLSNLEESTHKNIMSVNSIIMSRVQVAVLCDEGTS